MESAEAEPSDSRPEEDGAAPRSGLPPPEQPAATVRVRGVVAVAAGRRPPPPPRAAGLGTAYSAGAEHRAFLSVLPGRRAAAGGAERGGAGSGAALGRRGEAGAGRWPSAARRGGKGLQVGRALPLPARGWG